MMFDKMWKNMFYRLFRKYFRDWIVDELGILYSADEAAEAFVEFCHGYGHFYGLQAGQTIVFVRGTGAAQLIKNIKDVEDGEHPRFMSRKEAEEMLARRKKK